MIPSVLSSRLFASAFVCLSLSHNVAQAVETISPRKIEHFEKHVRPLLDRHCLKCHSERNDELEGNLDLDSRSGWARGGDLGPAIVPGKPDESLVIQAVRHTHAELRMPPDGKLSENEIRILVEWVRSGAPDPREGNSVGGGGEMDVERGREHWAFQSPNQKPQPLPRVHDQSWPTNELDLFILAELERHDLHPSPPADDRTLIRRATFDLTGLPPTPEEIEAFLNDRAPNAYERLIDRLLASPGYGERWGRFWLDVARYADSNGLDENIAHGNAWRYRDYVIASFNQDKPYDEFVKEQLAGDLLSPTPCETTRRQRIIATGFLSLGPKVLAEVDETKMEMDIIDEQVETVGRAFMGLTLGCARCHHHKFDPISMEDYYGLAGIFKSTKTMEHFTKIARWNEVNIATGAERTRHAAQVKRIETKKSQIEQLEAQAKEQQAIEADGKTSDEATAKLETLKRELTQLESALPDLNHAMAVTDYDQATDLRVHVRGSFLSQADLVLRRFPKVFASSQAHQTQFKSTESGRLQLAQWLVEGRHPLVARVLVNRLWRWHFGRGLVESTDNFGQLGAQPHNPPLLDWLSVRFVKDGWSVKRIHRLIMQSSTYRMSVSHDPANASKDEENRFQWRANVRRLEAEAIRDAILYVSGRLDQNMGGSLLHVKNREFLFDHTSKDQTKYDSTRRSVYLPVIRNHLYDAFQLFDYSDASVMNSNRTTTTVAPQALFMMNSHLVTDSAAAFASRVCRQHDSESDRIELAYCLAFGRLPTQLQRERATQYLDGFRRQAGSRAGQSKTDTNSGASRAWRFLCQTLLMSNEFIHIH